MASKYGKAQAPIAPHYYLVHEEFTHLRDKLETAMARPARPMGLEIVDGKAALKIWEQGLHRSTKRLPSLLHVFSNTILARSRRPSSRDTQRALIPLEHEVNHLLALHRQLWQQPFPQNFQEGQALLSLCIEKIAADLHDLFAFFINIVEVCAGEVDERVVSHVWDKEICCRVEMAAYKGWAENMGGSFVFGPEKAWDKFSCFVLGIMGKRRAGQVFKGRLGWEPGIERSVIM